MWRKTRGAGPCANFLHLLVELAAILTISDGYIRVCYYTNWSQYRPSKGRFLPENIDPFVCTHILFAFGVADATNNNITAIEWNDPALYSRVNALKSQNPNLKILMAIGGWLARSAQFSQIVSSDVTMSQFNNNALTFLRQNKFDGLDIDWEFPTVRGGNSRDRRRFTVWLQSLRQLFEQEAIETKQPRLLLMIAVVAAIAPARTYYQIPEITQSVDYLNIMTYDYHGSWDAASGAFSHAELFPDVDRSVVAWINESGLPSKLVMGIPAYGNAYALRSQTTPPLNYGIGQPTNGPAIHGPYAPENGSLTYLEICENIQNNSWTSLYLESRVTTVAWGPSITGMEWVGYDDIESLRRKAAYIREKGLAGAMLWTLDNDDYGNFCGKGRFPVASALQEALPSDGERTITTTPGITTTPVTRVTSSTPVSTPFTTRTTIRPSTATTVTTPREGTTPQGGSPRLPPGSWGGCKIQFMPQQWCSTGRSIGENPRAFALNPLPGISVCMLCTCNEDYVYNPCTKTCDFPSNRAACSIFT